MRLYVLATPIGNLEDLTLRGWRILKEGDGIIAEDTRVTRKLLEHYKIQKPIFVFHQHSGGRELKKITALLRDGKNMILVTDAGTPGIADPGGKLIFELIRAIPELEVVPLPGPNAAIAALSISGFPANEFVFLGFPPHKKGRQKFFKEVTATDRAVVFYESPHRILKALEVLAVLCPDRLLVVARELTKKFETIYRGTAKQILEYSKSELGRGEITVVVGPTAYHNTWTSSVQVL